MIWTRSTLNLRALHYGEPNAIPRYVLTVGRFGVGWELTSADHTALTDDLGLTLARLRVPVPGDADREWVRNTNEVNRG